eukprot:TRINITY_DN3514_c2_g1_i1.p1 TRINITY_DN3514_c2_g1~~TRINITY_DN3514_c2_g1_i1.p1  ORF type:complete len:851 (+),score=255.85 TRINITY_DN3514_c2_g1_i1:31-2553(+)
MVKISIRSATTSLVLFSIVVVAFFCTYFTILSGQKALDDTKATRDQSLDTCFTVGETNVLKRTDDFVDQVLEGSVIGVKALLKPIQLLAAQHVTEMMVYDANTTESWEYIWSKRSSLWIMINTQRDQGVTGTGYITEKKQLLELYERPETSANPADGFHPIYANYNNGTDYAQYGYTPNRTCLSTLTPYSANPVGPVWSTTDCGDVDKNVPTSATDPIQRTCNVPAYNPHSRFWLMKPFIQPGPQNLKWAQILSAGPYSVLILLGTYVTPGTTQTYGLFYLGMQLDKMSVYLSRIKLGSPKARVFTNVANNWMGSVTGDPQLHVLTGVSKGTALRMENGFQQLITPDESEDPIINGTGAYIRDLAGGYEGLVNESTSHEFAMGAAGEKFFLRVKRLQDLDRGIDWYCTIVIDRAYILGAIDNEVVTVRDTITHSSDSVDSRLAHERSLLIGCIVGAAVMLVVVCAVLVWRITAPLVVLQDEMSLVATMRLECVNNERSLSRLSEVHSMQESFLLMLNNLREYRNYIPASVLETSDSDDSASTKEETSSTFNHSTSMMENSGSISGSFSQSMATKGSQGIVNVFSTDIKVKKVSLVVVGCRTLHDETNITALQNVHRGYLSSILQVCKELKGIPDGFQGDQVYVSWNAVRAASNQASTVGRCCYLLERRVDATVTVGAVTGTARCGNMGCEGMKKFTFMGGLFGLLCLLEKLNEEYKTRNLVNDAVADHTKLEYAVKAVGKVVYKRHSKEAVAVHTVMEAKDVEAAEWMYELQEGERASRYSAYNKSVRAFFESNYTSALNAIDKQIVMDAHIRRYKEVLSQRVADKKPFTPLTVVPADSC